MNIELQNHRPLREIVYEELKKRIMTGAIRPGKRMMEINLAEDMGVSRTPVREAIRKLEREGLVTIEPRKGAYASNISVDDMVGLLIVREDLEGLAAELTAARINDEIIEDLEAITNSYAEAIKNNDTEKMIAFDELFHKHIVAASGNKTLIHFSTMVQELALRFRYLYYDNFSRYENMSSQHHSIIDASKSGNCTEARRVASEHVNKLKEFVIQEGETAFKNHKGARK